jgi:peptidoglycan/LPS O-acetylase OafA/YrhL
MDPTNPLFYVILMAGCVLLGQGIARTSKFYAKETEPPAGGAGRYEALDGLRGFLALGVFFHHSVIYYFWFHTDVWDHPPSTLYDLLGANSVAAFFMITGFLFWSKAIRGGARIKPLDLYWNRFRRIAPMCFFSVGAVLMLVAGVSRFQIVEPPWEIVRQVARCLTLGFCQLPHVNQVPTASINASVFWTLRLEWIFYLALPVTAYFATPKRFAVLAAATLAVIAAIAASGAGAFSDLVRFPVNFLCGMAIAHLVASAPLGKYLTSKVLTLVVLVPLVIAPLFSRVDRHLVNLALMFLPFLAVALGNDFFGLLRTRGAKVLGTISYSVYLMHGIVLYAVLRSVNMVFPVKDMSVLTYWALIAVCGVIVVMACSLTYRFVEKPFLAGKSRRPSPAAAVAPEAAGSP